jgi:transketolase
MLEMVETKKLSFGARRGFYLEARWQAGHCSLSEDTLTLFRDLDLIYRTLCGILYNFAPTSGHPGGSISSGRIVAGLLFHTMSYRLDDPECPGADMISYAAGHKAMGLYAMWALRNECARIARPDLLPDDALQLRLEDLLGFRKNPTQGTPLFVALKVKPLEGHPTPQTPFVKLATGASGVGVPASFGLAFGAMDTYRRDAPFVHVLEGEGGMTTGRVSEALAAAATAQLWNVNLHVDWNQASIDSNRVCRDEEKPGDYVQWNPVELCYLHDWNVIYVEDGSDLRQVLTAQEIAVRRLNDQPTAIVYRTVKGWQYGIEGRKSHGAGHDFCSEAYYAMLAPMETRFNVSFPQFAGEQTPARIENAFHETLLVIRRVLEDHRQISDFIAARLVDAGQRLRDLHRQPREGRPRLEAVYTDHVQPEVIPGELTYKPGDRVTLRAALGDALGYLNRLTNGAFIGAAADLLDSTSISKLGQGFPPGFYNAVANPEARMIATGGICEDCMGAFMAGVAAYGAHIGVGSSYGAFIAALQHIAARLHGIGQQARRATLGEPYRTFVMVCAHAGLKTGEDGATHADPQALQLVQGNFPAGVLITLTPWDPQELWPLTSAALQQRPAVLVPFVTRPVETIVDREKTKLPPATQAVKGMYALRTADRTARPYHGTVVLQGSEVANAFVDEVLPRLDGAGLNMNVFYVSSAELFALLPEHEQEEIFPFELAAEAMGITGFTLPTMYPWVTSRAGRRRTLHAFSRGHYLGSGQAHKVLEEAGLHGEGQWRALEDYARWMEAGPPRPATHE